MAMICHAIFLASGIWIARIDQTGLHGQVTTSSLSHSGLSLPAGMRTLPPDPSVTTFGEALKEQLGLKLVPDKAPMIS